MEIGVCPAQGCKSRVSRPLTQNRKLRRTLAHEQSSGCGGGALVPIVSMIILCVWVKAS